MSDTEEDLSTQETSTQETSTQETSTQETSTQETSTQETSTQEENSESLVSLSETSNPIYPLISDPEFQKKISQKLENYEFKMQIKNIDEKDKIEKTRKLANILSNAPFEIASHQLFIKNFMSFYSPYRNLLLYHGLGSGKTCSAILVCEEMRDYYKIMNIRRAIIVVAAPNIQKEFKKQLFNPNELIEMNGVWKLNTCVGNKLLDDVFGSKNHSSEYWKKDDIIKQINLLIRKTYVFMGYIEFANFIGTIAGIELTDYNKEKATPQMKAEIRRKLRSEFQKRLIVIDEAQNLRISSSKNDDTSKRVRRAMHLLLDNITRMKFLLLSATPMYNKPHEIVDLINIMRVNDERKPIMFNKFFDADDDFQEDGRALFKAFIAGYISYVKGDNPYTFPYRIYPQLFKQENSILLLNQNGKLAYEFDVDGNPIQTDNRMPYIIQNIDIYINHLSEYQSKCYTDKVEEIHSSSDSQITKITESAEKTNDETKMQMSFTRIQPLIYLLTVAYPEEDGKYKYGPDGLRMVMRMNKIDRQNRKYEYNPKYDGFFKIDSLKTHAIKIHTLIECIKNSTGIVLIYSEYIEGVLVPIALALEEAGITRYAMNGNLFDSVRMERVHYNGLVPESEFISNTYDKKFMPARYAMITGSEYLTNDKDMEKEMNTATHIRNMNGEIIKVILISKTGSEGIDFKNIRQVHIMEPWYNIYRIEQIIGRGVRFRSHKNLPFENRNVEIYMHGSALTISQMPVDIYIYKIAERKAIKISEVTRAIKESAVDCIVNKAQQQQNEQALDTEISIVISSGKEIKYSIGDKKNTLICDYMDTCTYECDAEESNDLDYGTYEDRHFESIQSNIIERIREIFMTEGYHIHATDMKRLIDARTHHNWNAVQHALNRLMNDPNEMLYDFYNRPGNLVRVHDYYMFQPIEMTGYRTRHELAVPVTSKHTYITTPYKPKISVSSSVSSYELSSSSSAPIKSWTKLHRTYDAETTKEFVKNCYDMFSLAINGDASIVDSYHKLQTIGMIFTKLYNTSWYNTFYNLFSKSEINEILGNLSELKNPKLLRRIVVAHIIDNFTYRQTLYTLQFIEQDSSEFSEELRTEFSRRQFNDHMFIYDYSTEMENGDLKIVKRNNGKWNDKNIESVHIVSEYNKILKESETNSILYGYYGKAYRKKQVILRVMDNLGNKKKGLGGFRLDNTGNAVPTNILSRLIEKKNISKLKTKDMIVLIEVILRYFDITRRDDSRWFLYSHEKYIKQFNINIY